MMLQYQGIAADAVQIRHRLSTPAIGVPDMLRCAKDYGLKASTFTTKWSRLARTPMPALAVLKDGSYLVLGKIGDDKVLVQAPLETRARVLKREELEAVWGGRLVLMTKRRSLTDLARRFDVTWFLGAIHKYRHRLAEVLLASFFLQLFGLVSPLFFQVVIDKVLVHRSISTLDVLLIGLVVVTVFETVLGILRTYVFSHTTNRIDVELGARLFRHLLALPIGYFQSRRVGDSVARVRELENIRNFLTGSALTLTIDLFFTVVFIAVMYLYSPLLTWIVLGSVPLYVAISAAATPLFRERLQEKFKRGAENQAFLVESVSGVETLKAMAVEPQMQRRWEDQLASYVTASFKVTSLGNTASNLVQVVSKLVMAAILYFGAKLVIDGGLTVGELVAFNIFAGRVSQPVLRLAQLWQDFHQARLVHRSPGRHPEHHRRADVQSATCVVAADPRRSLLRARQLSLPSRRAGDPPRHLPGYQSRPDGRRGRGLGLGKSTLAKLAQRLYLPESGRVLVDGVDLAQVDPAWLRRQMGIVLQENVLFNCSIRENIALADPAISMERVIAAARLAGAHDFILELPEAYDTIVHERGSSLSGGQRQRVAIARALVTNPRILILDEATSALDYESERVIQQNMQAIAKDRTVIIIAHRLSAVRHADRIITIDRGRIVEDGTHEELVRKGGRYAGLFRAQAGLHEVR